MACSCSILTRKRCPVCNTFHCCNRIVQTFTGCRKFSNIRNHVCEVIACLVRKPVQTGKLFLNLGHIITLTNQRCDGCCFLCKFIPTSCDLINGQGFSKLHTRVSSLLPDSHHAAYCNRFEHRKFIFYIVYRSSKRRHVDVSSSFSELFETVARALEIQFFFQLVQRRHAGLNILLEILIIESHFYDAFVNGSSHSPDYLLPCIIGNTIKYRLNGRIYVIAPFNPSAITCGVTVLQDNGNRHTVIYVRV